MKDNNITAWEKMKLRKQKKENTSLINPGNEKKNKGDSQNRQLQLRENNKEKKLRKHFFCYNHVWKSIKPEQEQM